MELIPQWRVWYKRWSTWLLTTLGGFSLADTLGFMPQIQQFVDPQVYKWVMFGLTIGTFLAIHVKQASVSGPSA
jgi:hypothetical protein